MEDATYKCECGSITWEGVEYQLVSANYVIPDPEDYATRIYYVSAEVSNDYGKEVRSVNFRFAVDNIYDVATFGGFIDISNVDIGTIDHLMEDVNFDNAIAPVRRYMATLGTYSVSPGVLGGIETASWSFTIREIVNGNMVGFPKEFKGDLEVTITD